MPKRDREHDFLRRVMLPNGTFKTTGRRRLDDLNEFSLPWVRTLATRRLKIMDVAASSGVTTEEWQLHLQANGIALEMTATDKTPYAYRVHLTRGITALVDAGGNPLHFAVFGCGISPREEGKWAFVKRRLRRKLQQLSPRLDNAPKISFSSGKLSIEEDDLLAPNNPAWVGAFDVVRAANILNRAYFPGPQLQSMAATLLQRLRPGGLLIVSRTCESDDKNDATIFSREDHALKVMARLNGGSEIEQLITEANSRSAPGV